MSKLFDDIPAIEFDAGRKQDVILEWLPHETTETHYFLFEGTKTVTTTRPVEACRVWADADLQDDFRKIHGVLRVKVDDEYKVRYYIEIDPRYDPRHVGAEIVAAAKLAEGRVRPAKSKKEIGRVVNTGGLMSFTISAAPGTDGD